MGFPPDVHPIERLRMVARAGDEDPSLLAREAAAALAGLAGDPAALVMAARRLVGRQPSCGPLWWVAARMLAAPEPADEALKLIAELESDATGDALSEELPDDAKVATVGWPALASDALHARPDVSVSVIATETTNWRLGPDASLVPSSRLGQAVTASDIVLLEADALGETGFAATASSLAAAAVGCDAGVQVWVVAGVGRVLPAPLWEEARSRLIDDPRSAGSATHDVVPARLVDTVVGPDGACSIKQAMQRATYPAAPELTRRAPAPGSAAG